MINNDELLFVVDKNNNPIEPKPRKEVHEKGYWHRNSHVWIINSQKEILCQKRSLLKDSNPGKWEPFFGGHLSAGVKYIDNAQTELEEELGIKIDLRKLSLWQIYKCIPAHEFQAVFVYVWNGDSESILFEKEEIDQLKWYMLNDIHTLVVEQNNNNWSNMGYENELLEYIGRGI
jgi:isopentenyldiphosphate isomerase